MSIAVTCASIASALAAVAGGNTLVLTGDCPAIAVTRTYTPALTIEAQGAMVRGLNVSGGGLHWRGGTIRSAGGPAARGPPGYGARIAGADVTLDGVMFIESNRSVVGISAINLTVKNSQFQLGQDGIIAAGGSGLAILNNNFRVTSRKPKTCTIGARVIEDLSARACKAQNGVWVDGWHQDAIQLRNGIDGIRVIGNTIAGVSQGIGEMSAKSDAPLSNVLIKDNDVAISGRHSITIGSDSTGVVIANNRVRQTGDQRTIIRAPESAIVCGNDVQRPGDPGAGGCGNAGAR